MVSHRHANPLYGGFAAFEWKEVFVIGKAAIADYLDMNVNVGQCERKC